MSEYAGDITGPGATRLLEAIPRSGIKTRFYQASSSELYGSSPPSQNPDELKLMWRRKMPINRWDEGPRPRPYQEK